MKANGIEVGLDAEIVVQSKSGEKRYFMTVYISGRVEHGRVYDCSVNCLPTALDSAIDPDDFIEDLLEEFHIQQVDHREEF